MRKTKPEGPAEPLTPSQVAALTEILSKGQSKTEVRDYALFRVMIDTMLRVSDVVSLTFGDLFLMDGTVRDKFVWRQGKTDRIVHCILSDTTKAALRSLYALPGSKKNFVRIFQLGPRQVQNRVKVWAALIRLDAEHISPHSFRRTKPTEVYKRTGNLRAAQLMLGHSNITTTAGYLGIERDQAIEVFKSVEM